MKRPIKEIDFHKILEILRDEDKESVYEKTNLVPDSNDLYKALSAYIDTKMNLH